MYGAILSAYHLYNTQRNKGLPIPVYYSFCHVTVIYTLLNCSLTAFTLPLLLEETFGQWPI